MLPGGQIVVNFLIISNRADFFREVHDFCRKTSAANLVEHMSCELWMQPDWSQTEPTDHLIVDPVSMVLKHPGQISENAFAAAGTVCQNSGTVEAWNFLTRGELLLWLKEVSPMIDKSSITEEIIAQSSHMRLAHLRMPMCCPLIPKLRERLMRGLSDYHIVEGSRENQFCMALEESLNNAFYHGCLEIDSELKELEPDQFGTLAAKRELLSPWCERTVQVTELVSAFGLWLTIKDEGKGFNVQAAFDRCSDPELLLASGRGLMLMRAFADELFYNDTGNEVTLVLYADGQDRELPLGTHSSPGTERRLVVA